MVTDGGDGNNWDHADWVEPRVIRTDPAQIGGNDTLDLTSVGWVSATSGWSIAKVDQSVMGNTLAVGNREYANGIGTHATSIIEYDVPEGYDTFSSIVGLDRECIDHTEGATVRFHVFTEYPTGSSHEDSIRISLNTQQLGFSGACMVRDLWAKKDIGRFANEISLFVRNHGAKLLKISETK